MKAVAAAMAVLVLAAAPRAALACAACGCGDATLTSMGSELPYAGRLRVSLDLRLREDAIGTPGVDRIELIEGRFEAGVSWSPEPHFTVLATLPFVVREVTYVNLGERVGGGVGDAELRTRTVVWRDRPFGPRHLLATVVGLKVPTGAEAAEEGVPLPLELQPGTGSFDPILGLSYGSFQGDTSAYVSAHAYFPLSIREGQRPGSSLRISASAQQQLVSWLAVRAGIDTRLDARSREDGGAEEDSGGFIGFIAPEVLVQPAADVVLVAAVRLPALDALAGEHDEGPITSLSAAVDF